MNLNLPPSIPFPVPTFQDGEGDASPAAFLQFMRKLISENLTDCPAIRPTRETWVPVVQGLSEHFLATFPLPSGLSWDTIHEKIKFIEVTLEVIERAICRVDGLFAGQGGLAQTTFVRLMNVCSILDLWSDTNTIDGRDIPGPKALRDKTFNTTVDLLRCLGGGAIVPDKLQEPTWKMLRSILAECMDTNSDILAFSPSITFPLHINFFQTPRIQLADVHDPFEVNPTASTCVNVHSLFHSCILVIDLLSVMGRALHPPLISQWFLSDIHCRFDEMAVSTLEYFLSSSCLTTSLRRAKYLAMTLTAAHSVATITTQSPLGAFCTRLLHLRLRDGPLNDWGVVDIALHEIFDASMGIALPASNVKTVVEALRTEAWTEDGATLREVCYAYLRSCLDGMDDITLQLTQSVICARPSLQSDGSTKLLNQIAHYSALRQSTVIHDEPVHLIPWRQKVVECLRGLVFPQEITLPNDRLAAAELGDFAVKTLSEKFSRPLHNTSAESRAALATLLVKLPCFMAHHENSICLFDTHSSDVPLFLAYNIAFTRLLDGPSEEVTPSVRQQTYEALARCLRHYHYPPDTGSRTTVMEMIQHGLEDKDRSVRLSAGRVVLEFIRPTMGMHESVEPLFNFISRLLDKGKESVKDSTLVTLGSIGKIGDVEVLGRVICCLVSQLGKENPIIRGTAYMQLLTLTRHHKKPAWNLVSPYIAQVSFFLVSRVCSHPVIMYEACRFLAVSPPDFMSLTLPHTLPKIFAACDSEILHRIARDLSKKPSVLFLNSSHQILAHIFLLKGTKHTENALRFIAQVLSDAADQAVIEVQSVVQSCVVPLIAELVVAMGGSERQLAIDALHKVERSLVIPSRGQRSSPGTLGSFLESYMLGVISHLNDMLQEVQGKKTLESKQQIIRSLAAFIAQLGPAIANVALQIMATLRTMLGVPELTDDCLQSWHSFLITLSPHDIGPHVGPTSASLLAAWPSFSPLGQTIAIRIFEFIIFDVAEDLGSYLDDVVDLTAVLALTRCSERLATIRSHWSPKEKLQRILERSRSDNLTVALQSLTELKKFMLAEHAEYIRDAATGDMFDPAISHVISALFGAACRDGDGTEPLRLLAFECIGILGAVDPDRFEMTASEMRMVTISNFTDESESVLFALHLIKDVLVGAFRSTSDMKYQSHLAYAIQELLHFCKFTPELVIRGSTIPIKVRHRWSTLPKEALETVTPLLGAKYTAKESPVPDLKFPIYSNQTTYREWVQLWTAHLITKTSLGRARTIFDAFRIAVRNKDVGVAHHILPHLVLHNLVSGEENCGNDIRSEILAVLEDQVDHKSSSTADKKLLSAQAVFTLMDHLNKWVRVVRQNVRSRKADSKRSRAHHTITESEEQVIRVESVLSSINQGLIAKAAFQCKAYARSLMNFEKQIVSLQQHGSQSNDSQSYYERLHEIYAHLDEPDGMEGVSTLILAPSLEHQIRQHESTGRWTSAQSCWEVRLQQSPDNLEFHLGLLRCLRNLGHYDTLRTHIKGVLTQNPAWETDLAGFQVEAAWIIGDWTDVQSLIGSTKARSSSITVARLLLSMRTKNNSTVANAFSDARTVLGAPITASGLSGYRRSYDAVLDLHLLHELEMIHSAISNMVVSTPTNSAAEVVKLSQTLASRLDSTLPTFRTREPILSMRRTAFALSTPLSSLARSSISYSWLASARIARKAGHWQTAYSAMLQAQQGNSPFAFIQSSKLVKETGEPLRALQELENSMQWRGLIAVNNNDVIDLTEDYSGYKRMEAKAQVLRARWMNESDRYDPQEIINVFEEGVKLWPEWESGQFHLGHYQDDCFKRLSPSDRAIRGANMIVHTVKSFSKAIRFGSKYVYETVPRLLTLWLDMGEDRTLQSTDQFQAVNTEIKKAILHTPVYKWFTAFPQIASRVGHSNNDVYKVLAKLIITVLQEYPNQGLWLFMSVVKSTKSDREQRGKGILEKLRNSNKNAGTLIPTLVDTCMSMTTELLALCDFPVPDSNKRLSMDKNFPNLAALAPSRLIIPLQESLTASLPATSSMNSSHQPFPHNAPTFQQFGEEIEIMRSLAKPRKISILGDNGQTYTFLGKPKDDLRKDARLMDFNAIINKLLKTNSESRKRQLHIRTYSVVTLNEECGFIQWVPNTIPIRVVVLRGYEARNIRSWTPEMGVTFNKIKDMKEKEAATLFVRDILSSFPPVFHEWFIETFPEPSAWLASRLAYGRTAAVMSMVGFILGLGDRHLENILLDTNTGDVVHVDFNCLFEKGKTLETPERVPFRLTHNMVDGLGVTGVEGVFRIACQVAMQLLRDNKDCLMSVLDAFIHDPLVEWEDQKRKLDRDAQKRNNNGVKPSTDLKKLAKSALDPIDKKLKGIYTTDNKKRAEREVSTNNLVQMLIQEASKDENLAKMYPGWAPWH